MKRLLVSILAAGLLTSPAAFAHTELVSSTPADKAVLNAAPKEITLHFTEDAKLTALSIMMPGNGMHKLGPLPPDMQESFTIATPELAAGSYMVHWRALSDDGHVAKGELSFEVK